MKKNTIMLPKVIINPHGHARDMDEAHKTTVEQYLKESLSALIGISILMPNTNPPITSLTVLERYVNLIENARKKLSITENQYIYFGITDDNLHECEEALKHPLVVGLKDYPLGKDKKAVTTGTIGIIRRKTREEGVCLTRNINKVYARHCDNPEVIAKDGYTINAETADVKNMIEITRLYPGAKVIICHVSCEKSAKLILDAQKKGLMIAIEAAPQYLWFDSNETNWNTTLPPVFYHCYNNLRPREDRIYLQNKLITEECSIVIIGSDSACHLEEEKSANNNLGGIPTHQEMVPVIITLAKASGISDRQIANLLSFNTSKFFGIPVSEELIEYEIEEKINNLQYNNGKVLNPWNGSRLWFPVREAGNEKK